MNEMWKKGLFLAMFAMGAVLPVESSAQALWGGTEFGMSVERVQEAVPRAVPPQPPIKLTSGLEGLLWLRDVEIAGVTFVATFYFKEGRLTSVVLRTQRDQSFLTIRRLYDDLRGALTSKYGAPLTNRIERDVLAASVEGHWISGKTSIKVFAMSVGERETDLTIAYRLSDGLLNKL